jgi:pilus assembly protein Flp/PilA
MVAPWTLQTGMRPLSSSNKRGVIMKTFLQKFARDQRGLTTVEYAVAGGLIVATLVAAFTALGTRVEAIIRAIIAALT